MVKWEVVRGTFVKINDELEGTGSAIARIPSAQAFGEWSFDYQFSSIARDAMGFQYVRTNGDNYQYTIWSMGLVEFIGGVNGIDLQRKLGFPRRWGLPRDTNWHSARIIRTKDGKHTFYLDGKEILSFVEPSLTASKYVLLHVPAHQFGRFRNVRIGGIPVRVLRPPILVPPKVIPKVPTLPVVPPVVPEVVEKPKIPTWAVIAGIGVVVLGGYLLSRRKKR